MDPIDTSPLSPFMKSNIYNRSLAPSFFMVVPWTPPFSWPSVNSLPTKPLPWKLPNTPATSFSTIVPPTPMAPFATMPVKNSTVTPPTSMLSEPTADKEATSTLETKWILTSSMAPLKYPHSIYIYIYCLSIATVAYLAVISHIGLA